MVKSRRMKWAGHIALMGENRNAYRILVGKPGPRHNWRDNVKKSWGEPIDYVL
jgi:hypothetical protein